MRIGILGLGGIGGFIGAPMAEIYSRNKDVEVVFICRGETLKNIKSRGVTLKSPNGDINVKPDLVSDNPEEIGTLDVIIITVKSFSLQDVIKQYEEVITPSTVLITIQNVVNAEELIRQVLPDKGVVVEGCIYVASNVERPGLVHHKGGPGKIFFGGSGKDEYRHVVRILMEGGLDVTYSENIKNILWSKYLFVSPVAAVTAAFNATFGEVIEDGFLKNEIIALMSEVRKLAEKFNIALDEDIIESSFNLLHKFPYQAKSSLQIDYEKGNRTEREFLVDYVYHKSHDHGLFAGAYKNLMALLDKK